MTSIGQILVYFHCYNHGRNVTLLQYLLLCLLLYTYPLQLFVVIVKFSTFIFTHLLSHELGEERERERERGRDKGKRRRGK